MTYLLAVFALLAVGFGVYVLLKNKKLENELAQVQPKAQASVAEAQKSAGEQVAAMQAQSEASLAEAQRLIDQQLAQMRQEADRIRQHYEAESRKIQEAADALVAKTIADFEPLRKYEKFRDAEAEAQRQLSEALKEATALRGEARSLLEHARNASENERALAIQRAKEIREQADAMLNQSTRDAGRIITEAERRAQEIGGEAYNALRD